jgi:hypothetical protein
MSASSSACEIGVGSWPSLGETQMSPNAVEARWAANSGASRPVGSNVNQPGQPFTATGVTGPTPRLSSRQTKTPRWGMACQPKRPSPWRVSAKW